MKAPLRLATDVKRLQQPRVQQRRDERVIEAWLAADDCILIGSEEIESVSKEIFKEAFSILPGYGHPESVELAKVSGELARNRAYDLGVGRHRLLRECRPKDIGLEEDAPLPLADPCCTPKGLEYPSDRLGDQGRTIAFCPILFTPR